LYVVFLTVINLYPFLVFFVVLSIYVMFLLYVYTFSICSCHVVLKVYLLTYFCGEEGREEKGKEEEGRGKGEKEGRKYIPSSTFE